MKLAAIGYWDDSIHMIIVEAIARAEFQVN